MMRDVTVAAICMQSMIQQVDKNLDHMESLVHMACDKGAEIVCFPELSVTGYILDHPENIYSESASTEIISRLQTIAGAYKILLIAGMIEIVTDHKPFISQIITGPDGIVGIYRKTHLSPPERKWYQAGNRLDIFSYGGIVFGVQLCYEAHFPEISTIMALKGAEILFFPHASPRGTFAQKLKSWSRHLPARAFDNSVYVVACNQVGQHDHGLSFPGVTVIIDASGYPMKSYGGELERVLIARLKKQELQHIREHRMRYFLPYRQTKLYREISLAVPEGERKKAR